MVDLDDLRSSEELHHQPRCHDRCDSQLHNSSSIRGEDDTHTVERIGTGGGMDAVDRELTTHQKDEKRYHGIDHLLPERSIREEERRLDLTAEIPVKKRRHFPLFSNFKTEQNRPWLAAWVESSHCELLFPLLPPNLIFYAERGMKACRVVEHPRMDIDMMGPDDQTASILDPARMISAEAERKIGEDMITFGFAFETIRKDMMYVTNIHDVDRPWQVYMRRGRDRGARAIGEPQETVAAGAARTDEYDPQEAVLTATYN
ncbi:hypothetical protein KSP40_PGU019567 [Platanthera guangdongensis]|uniref:Uncharacterized protein n=1 Tax=Platanthera guangdongensis TaxID=2320717 RepID=A0ABR2LY41_9ASPA